MAIAVQTVAVPEGAVSVVVTAALTSDPVLGTNWNTVAWLSLKTATTFTVTFSVPAPAGASLFYASDVAVGVAVGATLTEVLTDILDRAGEDPTDTAGDFYATARRQAVRSHHEICNTHPFLFLRKDPPGALSTVAPITSGTVAVTNGLTAITFSVAPTASVKGRKIVVSGWQEFYRIAAHTAGQQAAILDAAFNGTTNAAAAYTVFQDEYDLASDVRHVVGMWVAEDGGEVFPKDEKWVRENYPDPPQSLWPPRYYARIGEAKIRFNGYPDRARRIEYAYTVIGDDIDGAGVPILVPRNWRYVLADGGLYWTYEAKDDSRAPSALRLYSNGIGQMVEEDARKKVGLGNGRPGKGPY